MTTVTNDRSDRSPLFHPPGVIRVVTPLESAARNAPTAESRGWKQFISATLRDFARAWVSAQAHRAGP